MIILPNKYERLASALRIFVHKNSLKKGVSAKQIKNMRKIVIFEALKCHNELLPIDITEHASKLLSLIYIRKLQNSKTFSFSIKTKGTFMINPRLFSCLILSLCENCEKIRISQLNEKIIITAKNPNKESLCLAKAIKGLVLFERKTKNLSLVLSPDTTDKEPIPCGLDPQSLINPFSAVNVFG